MVLPAAYKEGAGPSAYVNLTELSLIVVPMIPVLLLYQGMLKVNRSPVASDSSVVPEPYIPSVCPHFCQVSKRKRKRIIVDFFYGTI